MSAYGEEAVRPDPRSLQQDEPACMQQVSDILQFRSIVHRVNRPQEGDGKPAVPIMFPPQPNPL
jgi:hypothetical protein